MGAPKSKAECLRLIELKKSSNNLGAKEFSKNESQSQEKCSRYK